MNVYGAYAGIITGAATVILWKNVLGWSDYLYESLPAFVLGVIAIVVVSLLTPPPPKEVLEKFDRAIRPMEGE